MKLTSFALLLLLPAVATAQQGSVLYDETVKIEIELPPEMEHMRSRIPSENTTRRQLVFDGPVSLMTTLVDDEPQQLEADSRGRAFRMMAAAQADNQTFTDRDAHLLVERRDFLGRTFLITGEPAELAWRLTGEQAEFLGYVTQRAVASRDDETTVEAWFAPQIPVPVGPAQYGGLPGLILVLTENDGRRTFVATEVSLEPLAEALEAPTRGRQVTSEEFQALVEERMREMGMGSGRGGGGRFRMGN